MKSIIAALAWIAPALAVIGLAGPPAIAGGEALRASQVMGKEARDAAGAGLGRVEDLIVDTETGDVEYVLLSRDGETTPRRAERFAMSGDAVLIDGPGGVAQPAKPALMRGSDVLVAHAKHAQAGDIGDVKDLMIADDGRVTHVVVAFDPAWYESDGWVAVPWRSFKVDGGDFIAHFGQDDIRPAAARNAAAAQAPPAPPKPRPMQDRDARLGKLIKAAVRDGKGEPVGVVSDLVVDMHERKIAFALVAAGAGAPPMACRVAPGGVAIAPDGFVLPKEADSLAGVPSCSASGWQRSADGGATPRYLLASELLRTAMVDSAGEKVGSVREVVVEADDGALHYVVADFVPTWVRDGMVVALPLRPVTKVDGGLAMKAQMDDLYRMPVFEEKRLADAWSPAFAKGMDKYLYGR